MKIRAGIIGSAGYTAGELLRLLVNHPEVDVSWIQSESQLGKLAYEVHKDLFESDLQFVSEIQPGSCDVVFLCKGHNDSKKILKSNPELLNLRIIDLSQDFRLNGDHGFVYGLPEVNCEKIKRSFHVANPGCFATAIQLALIPAIKARAVSGDVHISGITGSTGAGQSFSETSHFSWRSNNASVYKALTHQHLNEIRETILGLDSKFDQKLNFIPYRGAFTRGIITTSYFSTNLKEQELKEVYKTAYKKHLFTHVVEMNPDLKMVANTNHALVSVQAIDGTAVIISVIDNLLKGASGQAVHNMNLIFGLEETSGLQLKASAF